MEEVLTFRLNWEKPFDPDRVEEISVGSLTKGIYMFTDGTNPLLWKRRGHSKPIYIGKVDGRPIKARIKEHMRPKSKVYNWIEKKVDFDPLVTIASITPMSSKTVTSEMLREIENLLIVFTTPCVCDTSHTCYNGRLIEIQNEGYYWPLRSNYSTKLFIKEYCCDD